MVFDKINGDNYVYKTPSAQQFVQLSAFDKKFSATTAQGGFSRNTNSSKLGNVGTLEPITEVA